MTLSIRQRQGPGDSTLYLPSSEGPHPGILLLHGSEGGWSGWVDCAASLFAAEGFAACAFRYSRGGNIWNAGDIVDIDLEGTEAALSSLRAEADVGPKLGLYGVSRGGEHALLLTSLLAREHSPALPDAVAVHGPADVVVGGFRAAWQRRGEDSEPWDPGALAWRWRGSSEGILPGSKIPIELYEGPLYLSHGEKDSVWSAEMTCRLKDRLLSAGRDPDVHLYPDQDHLFDSETANLHYGRVVGFFRRHLTAQ